MPRHDMHKSKSITRAAAVIKAVTGAVEAVLLYKQYHQQLLHQQARQGGSNQAQMVVCHHDLSLAGSIHMVLDTLLVYASSCSLMQAERLTCLGLQVVP